MSTARTNFSLVTGAVGAYIGFQYGGWNGAMWGWSIGSGAGGYYYDRTHLNRGPQLDDKRTMISSYGAEVPMAWGSSRIAGNVIWKTGLLEHQQTQSGKGGPQNITYTYTFSCAVMICAGQIHAVRRIWANKRLVYDYSREWPNVNPGFDSSSIGSVAIYLGDETQNPDPSIVAFQGSSPAYRGFAYVVFNDFKLTEHYGNFPPQFEFEIVTDGTTADQTTALYNTPYWVDLDSFVWNPLNNEIWFAVDITANGGLGDIVRINATTGAVIGYITLPSPGAWSVMQYDYFNNWIFVPQGTNTLYKYDAATATLLATYTMTGATDSGFMISPFDGTIWFRGTSTTLKRMQAATGTVDATYTVGSPAIIPYYAAFDANDNIWLATGSDKYLYKGAKSTGAWTRYTLTPPYNISYLCFNPDRNSLYIKFGGTSVGGILEFSLATLTTVQSESMYNASGGATYARLMYDPVAQAIWFSDNYNNRVIGLHAADLSLYKNVPITGTAGVLVDTSTGSVFTVGLPSNATVYRLDFGFITSNTILLSTIVTDICAQVGLGPSDIDVTQLTDLVTGYSLGHQMSARDAINPLMVAFYFDAVESDYKVKFVKRGAAPIVTIPAGERAAHEAGSDAPLSLSVIRNSELELPWEVGVNFMDIGTPPAMTYPADPYPLDKVDLKYQMNMAYARRLVRNSLSRAQVDVPIVMDLNKGLEIAHVTLYAAWAQKRDVSWTTTRKYDQYEPTDLVILPSDNGVSYTTRITSKNNVGNGIIEWQGVAEDEKVYP